MKAVISIPKQLTHGEDLVVIRRVDYESLRTRLNEYQGVVKKIERGEKEFKAGKTRAVSSLKEIC